MTISRERQRQKQDKELEWLSKYMKDNMFLLDKKDSLTITRNGFSLDFKRNN